MCAIVAKSFQVSAETDQDTDAIAAISLVNAMLENISEISSALPGLLDLFLNHLQNGKQTSSLKKMLAQGLAMCFWYDFQTSLNHLQSRGAVEYCFDFIFGQIQTTEEDFEVKRYIIGLTALLDPNGANLVPGLTANYPNIIKALVWLSVKSIEIRQ